MCNVALLQSRELQLIFFQFSPESYGIGASENTTTMFCVGKELHDVAKFGAHVIL